MQVRSWALHLTLLLLYALDVDIAVIFYFAFVPVFLALWVVHFIKERSLPVNGC
jgi:hypothetical protein